MSCCNQAAQKIHISLIFVCAIHNDNQRIYMWWGSEQYFGWSTKKVELDNRFWRGMAIKVVKDNTRKSFVSVGTDRM